MAHEACGKCCALITLPALQKNFVNIFFVFAWEFCIEKWRGFLVIFFWSPSPTKRSTKNPQNIRGKFGAKFGAKSRDKNFEKFGGLSFCNCSDLSFYGFLSQHGVTFVGKCRDIFFAPLPTISLWFPSMKADPNRGNHSSGNDAGTATDHRMA